MLGFVCSIQFIFINKHRQQETNAKLHSNHTAASLDPLLVFVRELGSAPLSNKNFTASVWQFRTPATKAVVPLELCRERLAFAFSNICIATMLPCDAAACSGVSASPSPFKRWSSVGQKNTNITPKMKKQIQSKTVWINFGHFPKLYITGTVSANCPALSPRRAYSNPNQVAFRSIVSKQTNHSNWSTLVNTPRSPPSALAVLFNISEIIVVRLRYTALRSVPHLSNISLARLPAHVVTLLKASTFSRAIASSKQRGSDKVTDMS